MLGMYTSRLFPKWCSTESAWTVKHFWKPVASFTNPQIYSLPMHPKPGIVTWDFFSPPPHLPSRIIDSSIPFPAKPRWFRWCGNWTCHWMMSKSKKSSNLLIETRQDQIWSWTSGLKLLLLVFVCIELPCYFTQLCFKLSESFSDLSLHSTPGWQVDLWGVHEAGDVGSLTCYRQGIKGASECCHVGKSWKNKEKPAWSHQGDEGFQAIFWISKILFAFSEKFCKAMSRDFSHTSWGIPSKHPQALANLARPLKAAYWSCTWSPHCIDQSPSKQCVTPPPPFSRFSICFSRFLVTISHNNMDETANTKICGTKFPTTQLWHGDLLDFLDLLDLSWLEIWAEIPTFEVSPSFNDFDAFPSRQSLEATKIDGCCEVRFHISSWYHNFSKGSEYSISNVLLILFRNWTTNGADAFVSFKRIRKGSTLHL